MRKIEVQKMVENDVFKLEDVVCVYIGEKDNKEVIKVGLKKWILILQILSLSK